MTQPKQTPLHDAHVALGGKMVDFAGWSMPVQYKGGILAEHAAVREGVGLFDVSHMGEVEFTGSGALGAIQKLVTNDAGKLTDGQALYTMVCYPNGGIVDDCIVYRFGEEHFRIVVNASNIEKDFAHFREHAGNLCDIVNLSDDFGLIAVQGPKAVALAAQLGGTSLAEVPSFGLGKGTIAGVDIVAARTGYTGEDGFELFVPADKATTVWSALVDAGATPAGLGARDTLRLEAKLALYGNDIDAETTPLEATLGWTVKLDKGVEFVGHEALAKQKAEGIKRKMVGFKVEGKGTVRPGAEVIGEGDAVIGKVTSGSVAPTVGGSIGLAYVPKPIGTPGNKLQFRQRNKTLTGEIIKGPFYRRQS